MNSQTEIEILIRARYPILYIISSEEMRVQNVIVEIAAKRQKKVFEWTFSNGIVPAGASIRPFPPALPGVAMFLGGCIIAPPPEAYPPPTPYYAPHYGYAPAYYPSCPWYFGPEVGIGAGHGWVRRAPDP